MATKMLYNGKKYMWVQDIADDNSESLNTGEWLLFEDGKYSHVSEGLAVELDAELERRMGELHHVKVEGLELHTVTVRSKTTNHEMEDDREPFEETPELGWETAYGRG